MTTGRGAVTQVLDVSSVLVESHEDSKRGRSDSTGREQLVAGMERLGIPVVRAAHLPVDLMWTVGGRAVMFDIKTPRDLMASADDGRLHTQSQAMEDRDCMLHGYIIEGVVSADGITVGDGNHAWPVERFDNLLVSLQNEGSKVVYSWHQRRTPYRIAALYRWTGREDHASWRRPKKTPAQLTRMYGDRDYRAHIEALINLLPGMGEERANSLLDKFSFDEIICAENRMTNWQSVDGIGKVLATKWDAFLRGDYRVNQG